MTWDETNKDRIAVTMRKFNKEELDEMDLRDYLASDGDDDGPGLTLFVLPTDCMDMQNAPKRTHGHNTKHYCVLFSVLRRCSRCWVHLMLSYGPPFLSVTDVPAPFPSPPTLQMPSHNRHCPFFPHVHASSHHITNCIYTSVFSVQC